MKSLTVFLLILSINIQVVIAQDQTVGLFLNDSLSYNGYTLFAPMGHTQVYLIDNCGYKVHNWLCGSQKNLMAYLLEDGSLIRTAGIQSSHFQAGGRCGLIDRYSWDGELLWEFEYHTPTYHQHHDIEPLPNGNFLMIVWYKYTEGEAIAQGKDSTVLLDELWMDRIMEVDPVSNEIVWEWNSWDHLIQDHDPDKENYGVVADHPEKININYPDDPNPGAKVDWTHINSVDYNEELDQILLSVRNYSEIWIIDHSTTTEEAAGSTGGTYGKGGDLLYRWGNSQAYDRGGSDDQILFYMHDPAWIPTDYPDGGKIIVFNNDHGFEQSAVLVFDPPEDSPGFYTDPGNEAYYPGTYDWIYADEELYSRNISGAQRLPNGNTLICEGQGGTFTEVTYDDKELVWRYRSPVSVFGVIYQGSSPDDISQFKLRRYDPDFPGFEGRELIPGDPVELDPWVYDCTIWTDTITTSINNTSGTSEIRVVNPFRDELIINMDGQKRTLIQVFNMQGVLMKKLEMNADQSSIATGSWANGIYIIKVQRAGGYMGSVKVVKFD